jgi:hypothetical protein
MVYPDPDERSEAIRSHLAEYAFGAPGLRDHAPRTREARPARASRPSRRSSRDRPMVYRGRDRRSLGGSRQDAPGARPCTTSRTRSGDALAGKSVSRRTRAVGCDIPELEVSRRCAAKRPSRASLAAACAGVFAARARARFVAAARDVAVHGRRARGIPAPRRSRRSRRPRRETARRPSPRDVAPILFEQCGTCHHPEARARSACSRTKRRGSARSRSHP